MSSVVAAHSRSFLNPGSTVFLLCDVQERFRPLIHNFPAVLSNSARLCRLAKQLEIPTIATEQYPKAFGHLCPELTGLVNGPTFEKKLFSMLTPEVLAALPAKSQCVLFGIEAHVCVLHTALDLLARDHQCHIVVDAVSSQNKLDREVALTRLREAGCVMTTMESVPFQLLRSADHKGFKAMSEIVKEPRVGQNDW